MMKRLSTLCFLAVMTFAVQAVSAQSTASQYTGPNGESLTRIQGAETLGGPVVGVPIDIDLRTVPTVAPWKPGDPIVEVPKRDDGTAITPANIEARLDPLVNAQREYQGPEPAFTEIFSFDAQNSGANPNDPTGDIGAAYYIESYNGCGGSCVAIFDKTDGALVSGPFGMDTLSTGGICSNGLGDPIILYDEIAGRWFLSEFSSGGNGLCIYTARTEDPIAGGWCAYTFADSSFPDYPKYGVWPDQYIAGSNQGAGVPVYAFDRVNMLSPDGTTCPTARATQKISNFVPQLPGQGFELLVPVDLDGPTLPPDGAPGIFLRQVDEEMHSVPSPSPTTDPVEMWVMDTDFDDAMNTTLIQLPDVILSDFDSLLCPPVSVFSCVPQPDSGPALDPLLEVVMNKPTYRNFGSYEVIVGVIQTDIGDFEDHSGTRWFEFRRMPDTRGGLTDWTLHQEGTWSPDAEGRFMGMINMDQSGNILLGYNVSSTSVYPSIRYTGRLASDPLGTMTLGEQELATGGGVNNSIRYGDYNQMSIDPVDGCTFWMLGMYNPLGKAIRIGAGRFDSCGNPDLDYQDGFEDIEN